MTPKKVIEYKKIGELQSGDRIRIIRPDSSVVEGRYKRLAPDGKLPLNKSIVIEIEGEELTIPL
ncbi:hypothetical protein GWN26_03525 [Candidatus Saccharibacteria bacterium]|nr:hypothetical protein [Calditrichia bacterium]NIV98253.1 hypothetical protein [Candidatus Saccharibacteria bacterium]NIW80564.1 hypothetical protein [Calditrichia bacterium]